MVAGAMTNTPDTGTSAEDRGGDVRSLWLVRLRWGSVAGQVVTILVASRLASLGRSRPCWVSRQRWRPPTRRCTSGCAGRPVRSRWRAGAILAFDMLQLTALLYVSGGAANPFSVFYLVQITAAAATLGSTWAWLLTAVGVSAYATLFALPPAITGADEHAAHDFARHLQTMWVALTLAATLTAFFVTRLTTALARREREIVAMREAAARSERLSAVTMLAAGAAHELATPLTTVAVVAGELERALSSCAGRPRRPARRRRAADSRRGDAVPRDPRRDRDGLGQHARRDALALHARATWCATCCRGFIPTSRAGCRRRRARMARCCSCRAARWPASCGASCRTVWMPRLPVTR